MINDIMGSIADYFRLKDLIGPLVGGAMGWLAARHMARSNEKIETEKRQDTAAADREKRSIAYADDLSRRFKVLMDGYETRISDLTDEIAALRSTVEQLRRELADWTITCAACPHRQQAVKRYKIIEGGHDGTD